MRNNEPALDHTFPETRGTCGFCGGDEGGYAAQKDGKWVAACWLCIKPVPQEPQKRKVVGAVIHDDLDADEVLVAAKAKAKGMAPSAHRPVVR